MKKLDANKKLKRRVTMDQKENELKRDSSSSLKPAYTLSVFVGGRVSLLTSVMYLSVIPGFKKLAWHKTEKEST